MEPKVGDIIEAWRIPNIVPQPADKQNPLWMRVELAIGVGNRWPRARPLCGGVKNHVHPFARDGRWDVDKTSGRQYRIVPEDEVPDCVWVELAKTALLGETNEA